MAGTGDRASELRGRLRMFSVIRIAQTRSHADFGLPSLLGLPFRNEIAQRPRLVNTGGSFVMPANRNSRPSGRRAAGAAAPLSWVRGAALAVKR
jgi:hypothetical protein